MIMTKMAAVYLRRSTDRQEQSIGDQRRAILEYAEERGFEIAKEYVDDAISGADTEARRAFLQLIEDAGKDWKTVLVYDVSRFGRVGTDEAGYYRYVLGQRGVEVIYVAEDFRGDDTDDLIRSTKQWLAHRMVVDLSKVTIRGQLSRVNKGRWCGGRPPYGYDVCYFDPSDRPYNIVRHRGNGDRELLDIEGNSVRTFGRGESMPVTSTDKAQLVPGEAGHIRVVKRIFALYMTGEAGQAAIAARLNEEGIPSPGSTRGDGRWSPGTIREIIRNPAYRGATAWNRISYGKFHRVRGQQAKRKGQADGRRVVRNDQSEWVIVEGTHLPLISPEDFERAQRVMRSRAGGVGGNGRRTTTANSSYLLSGLIRCQHCGHRWQGRKVIKGKRKKDGTRVETRYYACGGYIQKGTSTCKKALVPQEEFEGIVMGGVAKQIAAFMENGGAPILEMLIEEAAVPPGSTEAEATLKARVTRGEARLEEMLGSITPSLAPLLEPKILGLKQEIEDARAELDVYRDSRVSVEAARSLVKDLVAHLELLPDLLAKGTSLERRDVLRGMLDEIEIDPMTGRGAMVFRDVPDLPTNETSPEQGAPGSKTSSGQMAGARFEHATSGSHGRVGKPLVGGYRDSMAQLVVRNLEDEIRDKLREMAAESGRSMEEEVREIRRGAVLRASMAPEPRLGSRLTARFRVCGLDGPIRELRGQAANPADLKP